MKVSFDVSDMASADVQMSGVEDTASMLNDTGELLQKVLLPAAKEMNNLFKSMKGADVQKALFKLTEGHGYVISVRLTLSYEGGEDLHCTHNISVVDLRKKDGEQLVDSYLKFVYAGCIFHLSSANTLA